MVEVFELRVYSVGEDDFCIAQTFSDPQEAIVCLKGLAELGIDAAISFYCYCEKE